MGIPDLTSNKLISAIRTARSLQAAVHRHPRRVSAAVMALMAGSAMTAFGVAPLTSLPEAATPQVKEWTEPLPLPELPTQLSRLDEQSLSLYRTEVTRQADTIDSLLRRLGVDDASAADFLRTDPVAATLAQGRAGKLVHATVTDGKLDRLEVRGPVASSDQWDSHFTRITVERDSTAGNLHVRQE